MMEEVFWDDERLPTSPYDYVGYKTIKVTSRYRKRNEVLLMVNVIDTLPQDIIDKIISVWCDTKACSVYGIKLESSSKKMDAKAVAHYWQEGLRRRGGGGHNGITVEIAGRGCEDSVSLDPMWYDAGAYPPGEE